MYLETHIYTPSTMNEKRSHEFEKIKKGYMGWVRGRKAYNYIII